MSPATSSVVSEPQTQTTDHHAPNNLIESFAREADLFWLCGELAASNAIINELLAHISELHGGKMNNYTDVFEALHMRRLNWMPIVEGQKFFPITAVATELSRAAEMTREETNGGDEVVGGTSGGNASPKSFQKMQHRLQSMDICSNHNHCEARPAQINLTKWFMAQEPVNGHMMNVVRGLKIYDEIFTDTELSKLTYYVNELRVAGHNGELSGETFITYNQTTQQVNPGNKRELIQFGAPIFGDTKEVATNQCLKRHIDPIPATLQGVIDHLVQWNLIQETKKPNSCLINFFDEGDSSPPSLKPPHLLHPFSTLLLSETEIVFGHKLECDKDGNYNGSLMLTLKEGSLLVMRGNSADVARHVICPSQNKRISITFFRVRMDAHENIPLPVPPGVQGPERMSRGGTGVFMPWNVNNSRKQIKHLPPRAQKALCLQGSR